MRERSMQELERRFIARYLALTICVLAPLLWAFGAIRNLYPFAAWTVMMSGGEERRGRDYYILRGETNGGETIELSAVELTNALSGRAWGMFAATVGNGAFKLRSPHPSNAAMLAARGGAENLPPAARLPELLRAYGSNHNSRLPDGSPKRLKAVRLEAYRWDGARYADFRTFVESWREEL